MQRSCEVWVSRVVSQTTLSVELWAGSYPLPVGKQALKRLYKEHGKSYDDEIISFLPFEGSEEALWALRVANNRSALDMFGLKGWTPPEDAAHDYLWVGSFGYSLRGHDDTSLVGLVRDGEKWWRNFSWESILGRPRGSGIWESPGHLKRELRRAVQELRARGRNVTQETVAELFQTSDRVLRRWLSDNNIDWREVKKKL
jgi:hypothetical protein